MIKRTKPKTPWIDAAKQPPKKSERIILCFVEGDKEASIASWNSYKNMWTDSVWTNRMPFDYWMPMPKPL